MSERSMSMGMMPKFTFKLKQSEVGNLCSDGVSKRETFRRRIG